MVQLQLKMAVSLVVGVIMIQWFALAKTQTDTNCQLEPERWSEIITAQLPLFANIELARVQAGYRMILVSPPEVIPLSPTELAALGVTQSNEEAFQLYFSTLERQLVKSSNPDLPSSDSFEGRRTDTLNLAYRAYVTRSRTPTSPWTLFSLEIKGPSLPPRDISEGAIAQAIRAWQRSGCPAPSDLNITQTPKN